MADVHQKPDTGDLYGYCKYLHEKGKYIVYSQTHIICETLLSLLLLL